MSQKQSGVLTHVEGTIDITEQYGYPDGTEISIKQNNAGQVHEIYGVDASPVANYSHAPNGSVYIPMTKTDADQKIWVKFGPFGATDGEWRYSAQLT